MPSDPGGCPTLYISTISWSLMYKLLYEKLLLLFETVGHVTGRHGSAQARRLPASRLTRHPKYVRSSRQEFIVILHVYYR